MYCDSLRVLELPAAVGGSMSSLGRSCVVVAGTEAETVLAT